MSKNDEIQGSAAAQANPVTVPTIALFTRAFPPIDVFH